MSTPADLPDPSSVNSHTTPLSSTETSLTHEVDTIQLLTRLIIGAIGEGGRLLFEHISVYQTEMEQGAGGDTRDTLDDATRAEMALYLAIGIAMRTQNMTIRMVMQGMDVSARSLDRSISILAPLTEKPLLRPISGPAYRVAVRLSREIYQSVVVGRREIVAGSTMVRGATLDIVDEFVAYISESPALAQLVSAQIGHQSVGIATALSENSRTMTGKADRTIEATLRDWLGLPARSQLAPSPFAGKPESIDHPGLAGGRA